MWGERRSDGKKRIRDLAPTQVRELFMHKWSVKALCVVVGGLISPLLLAWSVAYFLEVPSLEDGNSSRLDRADGYFTVRSSTGFGTKVIRLNWFGAVQAPMDSLVGSAGHLPQTVVRALRPDSFHAVGVERMHELGESPNFDHRYVDLRGWPWLCVWQQIDVDDGHRILGGLPLAAGVDGFPRSLPFRILWFGYALNTAVMGAIWWTLLFGPRLVRRWHRLRHCRCPGCAHDLRQQKGAWCPECGWRKTAEARAGAAP